MDILYILYFILGFMKGKASGGGGGGGGTLPAGAYWEATEKLPLSYAGTHFTYNGETYYWVGRTANGSTSRMYKYANGVYTNLFDFDCVLTQSSIIIIELGGILHASDETGYYHYILDLENKSVTQMNYARSDHKWFKWNGAIYCKKTYGSGGLYKWNSTDDTWEETNDISNCPIVQGHFIYNDDTYLLSSDTKIYKIVDGEVVVVGESLYPIVNTGVLVGNYCYHYTYIYTSTRGKILKYDLLNNVDIEIGSAPYLSVAQLYRRYDGVVCMAGGGRDSFTANMQLHEIEAAD